MNNPGKKYERFGNENEIFDYAIPIVLGICALLIRGPGLGKWCITIDEFYFSQPVAFIIEKGIPELPGGEFYNRGILLQYLTVLPVIFFQKWEFAIRALPLLLGVLTIPLFYMICRLFLPIFPAFLSSFMLLLSSWHIEFSRFARFYSAFQFMFFWFLYHFYIGYWRNNKRHQVISWFIAFVSIFIYEGSVFLPLLLSLAVLKDAPSKYMKSNHLETFFVSAILLLSNYFINRYEGWFMKIKNPLPSSVSSSLSGSAFNVPIELPNTELLQYITRHWNLEIFYIVLLFVALIIYLTKRKDKRNFLCNISFALALFLPLLHQYCISFFILAIVFFSREDIKLYFFDDIKTWSFYYIITIFFWFNVVYLSGNINKILHFMVGYPPIKKSIVLPFYENVPIWGFFIFSPIVISILRNIFVRRTESERFPLIVVCFLILIMPIFETKWTTTRYAFFFFPLFIIIIFEETYALVQWFREKYGQTSMKNVLKSLTVFPLLIFICTEDFNLFHIMNVSSIETNFRMGKYEKLSDHWYARADIESPVKYVNKVYKEGDVIVLDDVIMSKYIDKPYINYVDIDDDIRFEYHSRKEGRVETWSGRPLIYSLDAFVNLVPENGYNSLWLISSIVGGFIGTSFVQKSHTPIEIAEKYNLDVSLKYTGLDNRIGVWQFTNKSKKRRQKD